MDLTGSLLNVLEPPVTAAYGSYDAAGGLGSSLLDTAIELPRILLEMTLGLTALAGADLGSAFP